MIRAATTNDAEAILNIYSYYVLHSHSTFELTPPSLEEMTKKISESTYPWLVIEKGDEVVGYAYATQWKPRVAYQNTIETSVYLKNGTEGNGYGAMIYQELIDQLKSQGYHTLLAGISLPNEASIKLHEKLGFQKVAHFKQTGYKFDRWIDVGYWQLVFT